MKAHVLTVALNAFAYVFFLNLASRFTSPADASSSESQPWMLCRRMDGNKEQCTQQNYCCYDDSTDRCFPPTLIDDLECPGLFSADICAKYSQYCQWQASSNKCIRKQINTASACAAAIVQQQPAKDNTFCWGSRARQPCVLPFKYNGVTYTSCQSMNEVTPPGLEPNPNSPRTDRLWCALDPDNFSQPVSGWDYCECTERKRAKSVLMIVMDDMRPELSFYGRSEAKTPALDELANRPGSVVLDRAYTLFPICAPSRSCFLSGLSPDTTRVVDSFAHGLNTSPKLRKKMRTLPQMFKENGYFSAGGGKLYHLHHDDPQSWNRYYFANLDQNKKSCQWDPLVVPLPRDNFTKTKFSCQTQRPVEQLLDFRVVNRARKTLDWMVMTRKEPFFLAAGFFKPHIPFHVNIEFWDLYRPMVRPPERLMGPELQASYVENLTFDMDSEMVSPLWSPDTDIQRRFRNTMRTGYLAGISQTDEAIKTLLNKLEDLKLTDSTLVVVFGDNGLALGENGLFGKDTNFEIASRVPMMYHVPWLARKDQQRQVTRMHDFFQLFDIHPTIAGLMDIPAEQMYAFPVEGIDHSSRVAALAQRDDINMMLPPMRNMSYSQVYRCPAKICTFAPLSKMNSVGYSVRTNEWRYTVFLTVKQGKAQWDSPTLSEELYSHVNDEETLFRYEEGVRYDTETLNVAKDHPDICGQLFKLIKARFFQPLDLLADNRGTGGRVVQR